MERLYARLERWLEPLLAALLAFVTLGVFIQVVLRYAFAQSFLWGEELSLFAFIWAVYLGAAACTWRRTHFAFDALTEALGGRIAGVQRLAVDLCVLAVTLVMVYYGWKFSQLSLQRHSPALGITLFIPTLAIPLSGLIMSIVKVADIVADCRHIWTGEAPPRPAAASEPV